MDEKILDQLQDTIFIEEQLEILGIDESSIGEFVLTEIKKAIKDENWGVCYALGRVADNVRNTDAIIDLFNELLLLPGHDLQQIILWRIQHSRTISSIPYIDKMLEKGLDSLEHRSSDGDAIIHDICWALVGIGTPEAIDVLKKYSTSSDPIIRNGVKHHLRNLKKK